MPIEPGQYSRKKLSDAQINHFLDFLRYGGVMQDVASGTRSVKLSTGSRATIPNAVRTVPKAEIIMLYTSACDKEGCMKGKGRPSERTLWNILSNCPASQRKSFAILDIVTSEGSDDFDELISICKSVKNEELKILMKDLIVGSRYLKGDFRAHCSLEDCKGVADNCIKYALSDPTKKLYQNDCNYSSHENSCDQCESLLDAISKITPLVTKHKQVSSNEEEELKYDISQSTTCINLWKSHILSTINQEHAKKKPLAEMDENTAFVVIDFAMKFLSRRYRESMVNWFGKAGMGMHVSCIIMKDAQRPVPNKIHHKKGTYLTFIGKAKQDQGAVMAIYQSVLKQLKEDFPHLESIINKSDNAGCYHNEVLFAWKVHWPRSNLNLKFLQTLFNERQSGKYQCNHGSATAKRQMQYFIDSGNNINSADQIFEARWSATALWSFTANVLDVRGQKYTKQTQIKNISKIHHVKYIYDDTKKEYHVWQFSEIGQGRKYEVKEHPVAPVY